MRNKPLEAVHYSCFHPIWRHFSVWTQTAINCGKITLTHVLVWPLSLISAVCWRYSLFPLFHSLPWAGCWWRWASWSLCQSLRGCDLCLSLWHLQLTHCGWSAVALQLWPPSSLPPISQQPPLQRPPEMWQLAEELLLSLRELTEPCCWSRATGGVLTLCHGA